MKRRTRSSPRKSVGEKLWQEVRAEKVARARQLIADPAYPSKETLEAVARMLIERRERSEEI